MKKSNKILKQQKSKLVLSALSVAVSWALSSGAYASDLEIYHHQTVTPPATDEQPPSTQNTPIPSNVKPVLMLVLNIGDGMGLEDGSFKDDYGMSSVKHCVRVDPSYRASSHSRVMKKIDFYDADGNRTNQQISYLYETCDGKPTRVSVIKEAFLQFLVNPNTKIADYKARNNIDSALGKIGDFKIGLASNYSFNGPNGGQILYPAVDMDDNNRYKMAQEIAKLDSTNKGATPLALTIAETMAYFSGGTTAVGPTMEAAYPVGVENGGQWMGACEGTNPVRKLPNGNFDVQLGCSLRTLQKSVTKEQAFAQYPNNIYSIQGISAGRYTYYVAEFKSGVLPYSGFRIAHPNSKSGNTYNTPLSSDNECAANGVYFLSDGDVFDNIITSLPRDYSAVNLYLQTLNKSLKNQNNASIRGGGNQMCAGTLADAITKKQALGVTSKLPTFWSCAGEMVKYARARFDKDGNLIKNQSFQVKKGGKTFNADVRFASVGYGGGLKELKSATRRPVEVVLPGGTQKGTVQAYNCDTLRDARAKNMCKLGEHGAGFGEGGFYYVDVGYNQAVTESIVNFMFSISAPPPAPSQPETSIPPADRTPVSTGAMAAPIDPLTGSSAVGFAYLPILDPMPGVTALWNGNLKKYAIDNGKMVGANNQDVIKNKQGQFNTMTYDYWNKDGAPDGALPQQGGAYSQLFHYDANLIANYPNIAQNRRNLWVDDSQMTRLTTDNMATELTKIRSDSATVAPILTSFMTKPADNSNKVLGAVLHSRPQLITYEIGKNEIGAFDFSTRKNAVLYGSMDGALHLVDDKTGQELFVFVPQEILDLQPNALNKGSTNDGKVPYGVDGPWTIRTNYVNANDKYKAGSVIASGGLRMGGSKYYSLDITDPNAPKHLYTVGSNYGKKLQEPDTTLQGSGGKTLAENTAYARMGQSWAKPSVGYVRSGGKKIMVDFLAGGYDYGYESKDYIPNGNAQGNAVYMVQVGEEKINSTTNQIELEPTNSGKLLWWATQGTGSSKTSASTELQASQHSDMNHSVVSQIRVLDRDNDGYTDHIYYSDLGGRVWRADLDNKKPTCPVQNNKEYCTDNFSVTRVVKILDVSDQKSGTDTAPRFYERPLVTFTKEIDDTVTAMITVGTGNRSLPVSATRNTPDAIYTFLDKDVALARSSLHSSQTRLNTQNLTVTDLVQLTFTDDDKRIKTTMKAGTKQGWYYPLAKWNNADGNTVPATGLKSFNEPDALDGYLFATIYNPSAIITGTVPAAPITPAPQQQNDTKSKCGIPVPPPPPPVSGGVMKGVTQRILMCLPFGNCANDLKNPNSRDFTKIPSVDIGIGIIDNIITQEKGKGGGLTGTLITAGCTGDDCKKETPNKLTGIPSSPDKIGRDTRPVLNPRDWWEK